MSRLDRRSMLRSSLAASAAVATAAYRESTPESIVLSASQPPPAGCVPDTRLNSQKFADKWLTPERKFDEPGKVAAINMYGLIALLTQNGSPIGSLCVPSAMATHPHQPRLWVRRSNRASGPAFDWEHIPSNQGSWNLTGKHLRIVPKGSTMPASKASMATYPTEPWCDAAWLPAMNDIWPGLKPKSLTELVSKNLALAYFEFSGGIVNVGAPFSDVGMRAIWTFQNSTYPHVALTDNTWTLTPLPAGSDEVEILARDLGSPSTDEKVFATLKVDQVGYNTIPILLTNDVTVVHGPHTGSDLRHNKAFWKLVDAGSATPDSVPFFMRGMSGEKDFDKLRPINSGDPHCNGLRLEVS